MHQIRRVACDQLYTLSQTDASAYPELQKPNLFLLKVVLTAQLPLWSPTSSCLLSLPIKALGVPVQQSIILSDRGLGLSLKEHVGSLVRHGHDILLIKTSLSLSDWPVPVLFTPNILFLRQTHTHTHTHPHTHTHTHTRAHPLNNYLTLPWF